ncbi:NTP transferase domain-containing protein [Agrobacterium vitis]|uniref:phosphocholine cytidylyltransferase family protein n=1 Tax=Agrobacterium vitis TaxID=373 RepID=UPI0012E7798D|nr:phosphocholine cytidylyltransferase family protein [Agrobacterium vitis]MVA35923.1 NTP transferase domain-containing protein [Agrobacterium vitis]
MRAIILAAGQGSRIRQHTSSPKCLINLQGRTLIEHQINTLRILGINDIHVITGYKSEELTRQLPHGVKSHFYANFSETNNLWTLNAVSYLLDRECIVLFADVRVSSDAMKELAANQSDIAVLADGRQFLSGTMRIRARGEFLTDIGSHIPPANSDGNFIGIAKFSDTASRELALRIEDYVMRNERQAEYYTTVIPELSLIKSAQIVWMAGRPWVEIDDEEDLERAKRTAFEPSPALA